MGEVVVLPLDPLPGIGQASGESGHREDESVNRSLWLEVWMWVIPEVVEDEVLVLFGDGVEHVVEVVPQQPVVEQAVELEV